jgi:hypothetical protein
MKAIPLTIPIGLRGGILFYPMNLLGPQRLRLNDARTDRGDTPVVDRSGRAQLHVLPDDRNPRDDRRLLRARRSGCRGQAGNHRSRSAAGQLAVLCRMPAADRSVTAPDSNCRHSHNNSQAGNFGHKRPTARQCQASLPGRRLLLASRMYRERPSRDLRTFWGDDQFLTTPTGVLTLNVTPDCPVALPIQTAHLLTVQCDVYSWRRFFERNRVRPPDLDAVSSLFVAP